MNRQDHGSLALWAAEEGLARRELAVWVVEDSLTVEYGGEVLSRYEVECDSATSGGVVGRLRKVKGHTLLETSNICPSLGCSISARSLAKRAG